MSKPKLCVDHLGNKFDSKKEMCQHWSINVGTFRERQRLGWSLEKSLCAKTIDNSKQCTDHLGNKFDSQRKMCQHWNINIRTFRSRQRLGWSLKESLCGRQLYKNKKLCVDHLGNKFDSITKMCQYWKIEPTTFQRRQKQGWSLEESLCGRQLNKRKKACVDHLGNKFDSETKMCQYWNINQTTFQHRQKCNWSLEESLCNKNNKSKSSIDHLGNKFDSINDMCGYWNINQTTFRNRQKQDWSLEESLCGKKVTDPLGNKFDSQKDMCRYWDVAEDTFQYRQKRDWSLPEALGIIPRLKVTIKTSKASFRNYNLTPNITIIDNVPDTDCYFICLINNEDKTIYHKQELIDKYIEHVKSEHKKPKDVI